MVTTAMLRTAAQDAASVCAWTEAADHLERAIEIYPGDKRSALARLDIEQMTQWVQAYRRSAAEEIKQRAAALVGEVA